MQYKCETLFYKDLKRELHRRTKTLPRDSSGRSPTYRTIPLQRTILLPLAKWKLHRLSLTYDFNYRVAITRCCLPLMSASFHKVARLRVLHDYREVDDTASFYLRKAWLLTYIKTRRVGGKLHERMKRTSGFSLYVEQHSTIIAVYGNIHILIENELSSSSDSQHFTLGSFYFIFYILMCLWEQIADRLRLLIVQLVRIRHFYTN